MPSTLKVCFSQTVQVTSSFDGSAVPALRGTIVIAVSASVDRASKPTLDGGCLPLLLTETAVEGTMDPGSDEPWSCGTVFPLDRGDAPVG